MHVKALSKSKNDTFYLRGTVSEGKSFDETRNKRANIFHEILLSSKSRLIQSSRQGYRGSLKQKGRPSMRHGTANLSIGRQSKTSREDKTGTAAFTCLHSGGK
jgi:hypothetical protein